VTFLVPDRRIPCISLRLGMRRPDNSVARSRVYTESAARPDGNIRRQHIVLDKPVLVDAPR
jgi:hypothetical protein